MTPEFQTFKQKLLHALYILPELAEDEHGSCWGITHHGDDENSNPKFLIYMYERVANAIPFSSDNWVGRYISVEPNYNKNGAFCVAFMESVANVTVDYGPSISVNGIDDVVVKHVSNYLINGDIPAISINVQ